MMTIFSKLLYELEKKHDLMLVTIIAEDGSSPRGSGSQMLVGAAGRIVGTIGGGAVEHRSEQIAVELLAKKCSARHEFQLHQNARENIGMVCGGDVSVWFQYVDANESGWVELAGKVMEQISARQRGWLIQKLNGDLPALIGESGVLAGSVVESDACMADGCVLTESIFSMQLPLGERVVIFGGGHIAVALAPLLKQVGFRVTVMDCRPEYADPARFPEAEHVICGDYLRISEYLALTAADYVVIMTNGHSHDFEIQEQVLRGPLAYVGVIGSRSKKAFVNQRLRDMGITEEAIESIHTPIGIAIKAVTPEEIAVSIVGEMILVRAQHREEAGIKTGGCPMH